jgi:hypothetical protein
LKTGNETRKYKIISPNGKSSGVVELDPNIPAHKPEVLAPLALMIALASERESLDDGEFRLFAMALEKHKVSADEAFTSFWKAYADPYVHQGRIGFRHLWKHISEERNNPTPQYLTNCL